MDEGITSLRQRPHRIRRVSRAASWANRRAPLFLGADPIDLVQRKNEDLSVTNVAGVGRFHDGVDRGLNEIFVYRNFKFHLGKQPDYTGIAAVMFLVAALPSAPA